MRRAARRPRTLLAAVALLAWEGARAQSLYVIPTETRAPVVDAVQPLRVVLHTKDSTALASVLGTQAPAKGGDALAYVLPAYTPLHDVKPGQWLDATFVLDFREPPVEELSAQFRQGLGHEPGADEATRAALVEFVATTVRGSSSRGFDIASQVAVNRQGDCTEYSVLTAALARSVGIPARVVLGLALVAQPGEYGAYGHAWAELRVDGQWKAADAALAGMHRPVWYLPSGVLEDEGMGYQMSLARLMSAWVLRVEVLGKAAPAR